MKEKPIGKKPKNTKIWLKEHKRFMTKKEWRDHRRIGWYVDERGKIMQVLDILNNSTREVVEAELK